MEQINRVMIIDDDETFLIPLKVSLKRKEIECITYTDPEEAIEYLKTNKIDVLLVDYHMEPNINGGEVVRRIREFNQDVIIYLQTAFSEELPAEEMMDKYDIQGYIDKGKGDRENMQLIKSALKHARTLELVKEKDKEITKLNYKKAIMGNLITNLVNEAKDQLMQIGGMNEAIKMSTNDYEIENRGIKNALERTYELYEALNFESIESTNISRLIKIIEILLKPTILVSNTHMKFENENEEIIVDNVNNDIYLIIKIVEILIENKCNNIGIKITKENDNAYCKVVVEGEIDTIRLKELELLDEKRNFIVDNNIIKFQM